MPNKINYEEARQAWAYVKAEVEKISYPRSVFPRLFDHVDLLEKFFKQPVKGRKVAKS